MDPLLTLTMQDLSLPRHVHVQSYYQHITAANTAIPEKTAASLKACEKRPSSGDVKHVAALQPKKSMKPTQIPRTREKFCNHAPPLVGAERPALTDPAETRTCRGREATQQGKARAPASNSQMPPLKTRAVCHIEAIQHIGNASQVCQGTVLSWPITQIP